MHISKSKLGALLFSFSTLLFGGSSFAAAVNAASDFDNAVSNANLKNPKESVYQDKILNDFA